MKLFLAVDGGQSSTVALIADETGRVLGAGRGGPCNHVAAAAGREKFARVIAHCLDQACAQASLDSATVIFEAACLGFSGGVADKDSYTREFVRSKAFKITHDAEIALTGATAGAPGIIVIAGTGSIAFGKNAAGQTSRAGGWGFIFGDEGGAFHLVRQALRAALAMEEGWGPQTVLLQRLLSATRSASANQLMHAWYNSFERHAVAQFAPLVDEAARGGDNIAKEILLAAAQQLALLVAHVHKQLFPSSEPALVSYVGGVFQSELLTHEWLRLVQRQLLREAAPPQFPPAAGALLQALAMAGHHVALSSVPVIKS